MSGTASLAMSAGLRSGRSNWALAIDEIKAQAHRVGHGEDVGEQDRRIQIGTGATAAG